MKKLTLLLILAGLIPACTFADAFYVKDINEKVKYIDGVASTADLATKVDKAGTSNIVYLATAAGTNYTATVAFDATNNVFTVTKAVR